MSWVPFTVADPPPKHRSATLEPFRRNVPDRHRLTTCDSQIYIYSRTFSHNLRPVPRALETQVKDSDHILRSMTVSITTKHIHGFTAIAAVAGMPTGDLQKGDPNDGPLGCSLVHTKFDASVQFNSWGQMASEMTIR